MVSQLIDANSVFTASSAVNYFTPDLVDLTHNKSGYKEFLTLNPVYDPPLNFKIPNGASFPDLANSYIFTEWNAYKKAAADNDFVPIVVGDNISLAQAFGSTWMRNIKVNTSGREIFTANNLEAFKNYFDITLSYSKEAKETHLAMSGYYPDADDQNDPAGSGFVKRKSLITDEKTAQFITRLGVDVANTDKYFPNNTEIEIEIHPHDTEFLMVAPGLVATTRLKLVLKTCRLFVLYRDINDDLSLKLALKWAHINAKICQRKSELKTVYLEAGRPELNTNIFMDQIPLRVIVGMLSRDDYNGSLRTSPFNFKHFDIREIRVEWNGLQNPSVPYDLNFEQNMFTRAYYDMQFATGNAFSQYSNGITMDQFKNGSCIFVFNLTPTLEDDKFVNVLKYGTTSLHAKFHRPIPVGGMTMVIYAEFESRIILDKNRNVTTDLTV